MPEITESRRAAKSILAEAHEEAAAFLASLDGRDCDGLLREARALAVGGFGTLVGYSPKVFVPLTQLCRDSCRYCTFAHSPRPDRPAYLPPADVLAIVKSGEAAGCREALLTLGDKPEHRYAAARRDLEQMGYRTTIDYLVAICEMILAETALLPHINPGIATADELARLRRVSVSQGLMLETAAQRLCRPGAAHDRCPDKVPLVRMKHLVEAGMLGVPMTSGILVGIGETRLERVEALLALRKLHDRYGHVQEVIVQNFRAKPGTAMADAPEPTMDQLIWTAAAARLILGGGIAIQVPPNLSQGYGRLLEAGINDWGGISPVTPDFVNPETSWPDVAELRRETEARGRYLQARLAVHPHYCRDPERWLDPGLVGRVLNQIDAEGYCRDDGWTPGLNRSLAAIRSRSRVPPSSAVARALDRFRAGDALDETAITTLFRARGADMDMVCDTANRLRRETHGETVSYVVNRNINYTNVCKYHCHFCAFSKTRLSAGGRDPPFDLNRDEIVRRAREAWARGATEVCMQGGIHPDYNGSTYLDICSWVKEAEPRLHLHAFSPLEVAHGAQTLGLSLESFLLRLRDAGLGSLPGTAAEILDDAVRARICPDKLTTDQWLEVVESAHNVGLRTTATIMFGHVDGPEHWARHLLRIRALQKRTGGFTEFVPLPFVPMDAPIYQRGGSRPGPTFREVRLMHAIARLTLHPVITNIQASWVKLGAEGVRALLEAGVNDLGGTLMNESISRAAGSQHGQEMDPGRMEALIRDAGRIPHQRTTLYAAAPEERRLDAHHAAPLAEVTGAPLRRSKRPAPETRAMSLN